MTAWGIEEYAGGHWSESVASACDAGTKKFSRFGQDIFGLSYSSTTSLLYAPCAVNFYRLLEYLVIGTHILAAGKGLRMT